jgi:hypothetical protein
MARKVSFEKMSHILQAVMHSLAGNHDLFVRVYDATLKRHGWTLEDYQNGMAQWMRGDMAPMSGNSEKENDKW